MDAYDRYGYDAIFVATGNGKDEVDLDLLSLTSSLQSEPITDSYMLSRMWSSWLLSMEVLKQLYKQKASQTAILSFVYAHARSIIARANFHMTFTMITSL